jgi:hypothetical protein
VPELIDQSMGTWNIGKLNQNFLPMDIEVIKSIPICTAPVTDSWAWHFEKQDFLCSLSLPYGCEFEAAT